MRCGAVALSVVVGSCFSPTIPAGAKCSVQGQCAGDAECAPDVDRCFSPASHVVDIAVGQEHSCALIDNGRVRCWGNAQNGRLGPQVTYLENPAVGDDEHPGCVAPVPIDGVVVQVASGNQHSCALLTTGAVHCWGFKSLLGSTSYDEPVALGIAARHLAAGGGHTCAVTTDDQVRCWGQDNHGELGYGAEGIYVDSPADAGDINLGATNTTVHSVSVGSQNTCAVFESGDVKCWGRGDNGANGTPPDDCSTPDNNVGACDVADPGPEPMLELGGRASNVSVGSSHSCALIEGGFVRCWGDPKNDNVLGIERRAPIGVSDHPNDFDPVRLGALARAVTVGTSHTCALLEGGQVRCWGFGANGRLGTGLPDSGGVLPGELPTLDLGAPATALAAGHQHTCAVLASGHVTCWGFGANGRLGYANTNAIGDDETPATNGPVSLLACP